jgi:hypothetical protein
MKRLEIAGNRWIKNVVLFCRRSDIRFARKESSGIAKILYDFWNRDESQVQLAILAHATI